MPDIAKSVGTGGQNDAADVTQVQTLLNNFVGGLGLPPLVVNGGFDSETGDAITAFQSKVVGMAIPDGRIDPGGKTWRALAASPAPAPAPDPSQLSGAAWWHANQGLYVNSNRIEDLDPDFATKVRAFVTAMRNAGATVQVSSTRRNKVRAYLMHYSWTLAAGTNTAASIPPEPGCHIIWDHGNEAASRAAAAEMRDLFNIAYQPSLTSRHIEGKAIDMTISWTGTLAMIDGQGQPVSVPPPCSGDINARLHQVGRSYGVIKLLSDKPHWSTDGH